jgi:predicted aspartyl protease
VKPACLILLMSAALPAADEIALKAERVEHVLVLKQVYLNEHGPYRMMIDTGAASCLIRPAIAKRLGVRPAYAVEHATIAGVKRVPVVILDNLRVGPASDQAVEAMVTDVELPGVDGVLGQSWLVRHDYLLDYRGRRLVLNAPAPEGGVSAELRSADGTPEISTEVNGRRQELVVDSGASNLILFRPSALSSTTAVATNGGSFEARIGSASVRIGGVYTRLMTAVNVDAPPRPGLLPAASFGSVYVSNRHGVVILLP